MPPLHLRSAVEALLFSSDQPLTLVMLADALDAPTEELTEVLRALGDEYVARSAGVELREMAGGWIVTTTAEQHEWVARMLRGKRRMRLSRAALETLAIIAYKQPVTKSEIEAIRGVDSSGTLATLLERALVTIKGRSTVVGRPLLYGSTPDFLNYFGLRDLAELPRPEELRALVAAREPEQLEMLELDGDGMPLALAPPVRRRPPATRGRPRTTARTRRLRRWRATPVRPRTGRKRTRTRRSSRATMKRTSTMRRTRTRRTKTKTRTTKRGSDPRPR
jgi:segregation and condensation protein B